MSKVLLGDIEGTIGLDKIDQVLVGGQWIVVEPGSLYYGRGDNGPYLAFKRRSATFTIYVPMQHLQAVRVEGGDS